MTIKKKKYSACTQVPGTKRGKQKKVFGIKRSGPEKKDTAELQQKRKKKN